MSDLPEEFPLQNQEQENDNDEETDQGDASAYSVSQERKKLKRPFKAVDSEAEDEDEDSEEEEVDPKAAMREMDGFIVNDNDPNDEEEDDEEEDEDEDEDAGLDEDDLDLIAENMGLAPEKRSPIQQKYHRLRRPGREEDEEETQGGDGGGRDLFGEDEDGPAASDERWKGSVEGAVEEGGEGWVDEGQRGGYSMHAEIEHLITDVFGDAAVVMEILRGKRHREVETDETLKSKKLKSATPAEIGHDENEESMLGDDEMTLTRIGQPERLYSRYRRRPVVTSETEIALEAKWLTARIVSELVPDLSLDPQDLLTKYKERLGAQSDHYDPATKTVEQDIEEKTILVLEMLLNERLEVPFILTHRAHLICPPLNDKIVWMIYEFDLEWWRLRHLSWHLQKLISSLPEPRPPALDQLFGQLENFRTEEELEDVRLSLLYNFPDLYENDDNGTSTNLSSTGGNNRRRRQTAPGLDALRLIKKFKLDRHWKQHLLNADQLSANLSKSDAFNALLSNPDLSDVPVDLTVEHAPPEEPPLPGRDSDAVKSWLNSLIVGPFSSGTRVLDSLLSHEAKVLASHPSIRSSIRRWFRCAVKLTTVTTSTGEQSVVPGMSNWGALHLNRIPVDLFLNQAVPPPSTPPTGPNAYEIWRKDIETYNRMTKPREVFADIMKAEANHLAQLVIHPTMPSDLVPWRGENEELFAKHYSRKMRKLAEVEKSMFKESDRLDQEQVNKLLFVLKGLYLDPSSTGWGTVVQEKILIRLIERELLPTFRKEIRQLLSRRAHSHIASRCQANLEWRLGLRPFRRSNGKPFFDFDDDSDESDASDDSDDEGSDDSDSDVEDDDRPSHWSPRIVSLIVERIMNGCRVHAMAIDRTGMPTQYRKFDRLLELWAARRPLPEATRLLTQKRVDAEKKALRRFFLTPDVSPDLVLIGASDVIARNLMDEVKSIREKLRRKRRFEVMFGALEVPRIFAASELCPPEYRENYGPAGCQGIGLGRFVQDPLASHLQLWSIGTTGQNLLLDLKLHPLQDTVPKEKLESALLQTIQMTVAKVGVDLQAMKGQPHLQSPLQFVSGLGLNKATDILHRLALGNSLLVRAELQSLVDSSISDEEEVESQRKAPKGFCDGPVGPGVYRNCASFIRIPHDPSLEGESLDPLAATRIDPVDCYNQAQKMCRDALEDTKVDSPNEAIWRVMKHPDCLEELDLEAYSLILNSKKQIRMLPLLEFIRRELENPYRDPRMSFETVGGERLLYLLIQEDPHSFCRGCEITASIVESRAGIVRLTIPPSEINAIPLDLSEYLREESMKFPSQYASSDMILPKGGLVACRLEAIKAEDFSVNVVLTTQLAVDILIDRIIQELPGFLDRERVSLIITALVSAQASPSQIDAAVPFQTGTSTGISDTAPHDGRKYLLKRRITHVRFRQFTSQKALMELRPQTVRIGEAIFKPSDKSDSEVILLIKVCSKPFLCKVIAIQESNQRNPGDLGQELKIGNEKFYDLDQILGQYVEAFRVNLQEVYTFEKYREGDSLQAVEQALIESQEQKTTQTGMPSIEWGIMVDGSYEANYPGVKFHLIAIPPRQPHCSPVILRDSVYVTHEGFKLWNHREKSFRRLTSWWKQEGYFQRSVLLAEYQIAKKKQFEKKQQKPQQLQGPNNQNRHGSSSADPTHWGGSGSRSATWGGSGVGQHKPSGGDYSCWNSKDWNTDRSVLSPPGTTGQTPAATGQSPMSPIFDSNKPLQFHSSSKFGGGGSAWGK